MAVRLVLLVFTALIFGAAAAQIALPNCPDHCGNLTIPYPFGTTNECCKGPEYFISCTADEIIPYLWSNTSNVRVTDISVESGEIQIQNYLAYDCYDSQGKGTNNNPQLRVSPPYTISGAKNKFMAVGCDTWAMFNGSRWDSNEPFIAGCMSKCLGLDSVDQTSCSGIGCCETSIPDGLTNRRVILKSFDSHRHILGFNNCSYAFIVQEGKFHFSGYESFRELAGISMLPMILNWNIGNGSCEAAAQDKTNKFACYGNTTCVNRTIGHAPPSGYLCQCLPRYSGNPYHPDGCQDVDECDSLRTKVCGNGTCHNTDGNYYCDCNKGFRNQDEQTCIPGTDAPSFKIPLAVSLSLFAFVVVVFGINSGVKSRKLRKEKAKFYKRNGGLLVQQQLASYNGSVDEAAIFSEQQIKNFTNNYDENRKLGEGGFGIVYKGILPGLAADKSEVAVKLSKLNASVSNSSEFGNEVILLSQVKHKNVLKLRGCCLETKTPILVFEYVSQGTLYDHIHKIDGKEPLSWDLRLKIAAGTARALAYLHHSLDFPIIHRDVKSMNILLDKNFEAKISDFGASRLMDENENQVATAVQGTFGYLDPEYTELGILTKKSDVFSFGVVLAELLTSLEARSKLADVFVHAVKEKRLHEILDPDIAEAEHYFPTTVEKVADLAKRCLAPTGNERPAMDKVAVELGDILVEVTGKEADEGGLDFKGSPKDTDYLLGSPANYIVDVRDYGVPVIMATSVDYHQSMQNQSQMLKPHNTGR